MAKEDITLAVLGSGTCSLFEAMAVEGLPIKLFFSDRPCRGLAIAQAAGIPFELVARKRFLTGMKKFARGVYPAVVNVLHRHNVGLVAMAGFMTVFSEPMFEPGAFAGRILNTHPALLPSFPGDDAVQDALNYGVRVTGCTVHVATLRVDAGPILAQEPVRVFPGDTKETLHERHQGEGACSVYGRHPGSSCRACGREQR